MFENAGNLIIKSADLIWGAPILILLLGGGFYFLIYSRLAPFAVYRPCPFHPDREIR
jgi:alanine or glycine:cation symporter, AGCS family